MTRACTTEPETRPEPAVHTGGCLCGAVRYRVEGPLRDVYACHCRQCRRTSGHFVAATSVADERLTLLNEDGLRWYRSSGSAQRGFCRHCGGNLFWKPAREARTAIMAGTLDGPTGLRTAGHIFVDYAGDYYRIDDGLPRYRAGRDSDTVDG